MIKFLFERTLKIEFWDSGVIRSDKCDFVLPLAFGLPLVLLATFFHNLGFNL